MRGGEKPHVLLLILDLPVRGGWGRASVLLTRQACPSRGESGSFALRLAEKPIHRIASTVTHVRDGRRIVRRAEGAGPRGPTPCSGEFLRGLAADRETKLRGVSCRGAHPLARLELRRALFTRSKASAV